MSHHSDLTGFIGKTSAGGIFLRYIARWSIPQSSIDYSLAFRPLQSAIPSSDLPDYPHPKNPTTMRLPYIPDDPKMETEEDAAVVQRVKDRRGGKLIALDKTLLHAPPVANGWNGFLGAIRTQTSLPDSIRELAICRVAVLNKAWYEWDSHRPILEKSGVLSAEAIEHLKERPRANEEVARRQEAETMGENLFDEKHSAVLEYTDAMTIGCIVPEPVFERLRSFFTEREVVEITSTIAAYNCVSRFLVALDVGEMAEKYGVDMSGKAA